MTYKTEQENFWAGEFGAEYIDRNSGETLVNSNVVFFSQILKSAPDIKSILELGCNIGLNLQALNRINPSFEICGYEINETAAAKAEQLGVAKINRGTILNPLPSEKKYDLVFTKGVLIHINPEELDKVYRNLVELSSRYVLVCEYYNPTPMTLTYRGNANRLFKRDFAGELIEKYKLRLVNYGFVYRRDNYFPQDDISWFLLAK
jgi:pseudaminic acid biosynthesis-associated methylase